MARIQIKLWALTEARQRLRQELHSRLTDNHASSCMAWYAANRRGKRLRCAHLSELPAIRWKLQNLRKLKRTSPERFARQARELTQGFER